MAEFARYSRILQDILFLEHQNLLYAKAVEVKGRLPLDEKCQLVIPAGRFRTQGENLYTTSQLLSSSQSAILTFLERSGLGAYLEKALAKQSLHSPVILPDLWPREKPFIPIIYKGQQTLMLTGTHISYSTIAFTRLGGLHPAIPRCDMLIKNGEAPACIFAEPLALPLTPIEEKLRESKTERPIVHNSLAQS